MCVTVPPTFPKPASERGFLSAQADVAKAALVNTTHELRETLAAMTDVRAVGRRHPWILLASAVAVGFATGVLLPDSGRQAVACSPPTGDADGRRPLRESETRSRKAAAIATVGRSLSSLLQSLAQGWITTVLFARGKSQVEVASPDVSAEAPAIESAEAEALRRGGNVA